MLGWICPPEKGDENKLQRKPDDTGNAIMNWKRPSGMDCKYPKSLVKADRVLAEQDEKKRKLMYE